MSILIQWQFHIMLMNNELDIITQIRGKVESGREPTGENLFLADRVHRCNEWAWWLVWMALDLYSSDWCPTDGLLSKERLWTNRASDTWCEHCPSDVVICKLLQLYRRFFFGHYRNFRDCLLCFPRVTHWCRVLCYWGYSAFPPNDGVWRHWRGCIVLLSLLSGSSLAMAVTNSRHCRSHHPYHPRTHVQK